MSSSNFRFTATQITVSKIKSNTSTHHRTFNILTKTKVGGTRNASFQTVSDTSIYDNWTVNDRQCDLELFYELKQRKRNCTIFASGGFEPGTRAWQGILNTTAQRNPPGNFLNFLSIYLVTLTIIES